MLVASCRTSAPPTAAFQPFTAASEVEAWDRLLRTTENFAGARILARFSGAQSFRAVVAISACGDLQIHVLSPLGTTVATIDARGETVHWREDGVEKTSTLRELGQRLLGISTGDWESRDVAMLLLGLPADASRTRFTYGLTRRGIETVRSGATEVTYDPPAFPPRVITLKSETGSVRVEILELVRL